MTSRVQHVHPAEPPPSDDHAWLANLVRELFQTEQSARRHPRIEIQRLGDVPPARILRAIATHADEALATLPGLVTQDRLPVSVGGRTIGAAFSVLRDQIVDLFLNAERSYRATLLGMRHGVDLVVLLEQVARRDGADALADWSAAWLERRRDLLADAEAALSWFAEHPERAQEASERRPLARAFHAFLTRLERIADRRRRATASAGPA